MSKFLKALDQAQRDRALVEQARARSMPQTPTWPADAMTPPPVGSAVSLETEPIVVDGIAPHLVSLVDPVSFEAEQYRTLRHIVEQAHRTANVRVLAVSAAAVGDGKTTTAINLAGALAQAPDASVLLMDADLRHPAVATGLGLGHANLPGLVEATLDPALSLGHVVRRLPPFNLSVLVAGHPPTAPYELLKSPRMAELWDQARREYDYVVVDTPPLVALSDCRVLANRVDAFLLVVTAHKTPRRLLEAALGAVEPASILGLVFNGDDDSATARYGREARDGHGGNGASGRGSRGSVPPVRRLVRHLGLTRDQGTPSA
jgi:capsular exopolysaccharide synthesis family protein